MLPDWPRAWGGPSGQAILRGSNSDFLVEEQLDLVPSDDGEFDWLWIEKSGDSTEFVAKALARHADVAIKAVGYSGLKDRHALTRQWFCVHKPGKARIDWQLLTPSSWRILKSVRHRQKLRRGSHRSNAFVIRLTGLDADNDLLASRLGQLAAGIPNYFGEQRFGYLGANITRYRQWQSGDYRPSRFERSLLISSARSWLFNSVLAQRIADQNWNQALDGELFALRDSNSVFSAELDEQILQRVADGDLHPSGPLFGKAGKLTTQAKVAELEQSVFEMEPQLCDSLKKLGLTAERRPLRVLPKDFSWQFDDPSSITLRFSLPRGCFATALVRELVEY